MTNHMGLIEIDTNFIGNYIIECGAITNNGLQSYSRNNLKLFYNNLMI